MSLFGKKKYDPTTDLTSSQNDGFDHLNYVVKPGTATVREPKQKGEGGSVVILPYPMFEVDGWQDKKLVWPDCPPDAAHEFGESTWCFVADGVRRFGKNQVTFLYNNPDEGFSMKDQHPVELIREAAFRVKKGSVVNTPLGDSDKDGWVDLLDGFEVQGRKTYGCLNKSDRLMLLNVVIYALGKTIYDPQAPLGSTKEDNQVVFLTSRDAGHEFWSAINTLRNKETDKVDVPITGAKVFHFYDRKNPASCRPKQNAEAAAMVSSGFKFGGDGDDRRRPGNPLGATSDASKEMAGYKVYMTDTFDGRPDSPLVASKFRDAYIDLACKKVKPWEKVLRGYTPDEAADLIGRVCGLPLSLLYHAWKAFPRWYPEELRYALTRPSTAQMSSPAPVTHQAPAQEAAPVRQAAPVEMGASFRFGADAPVAAQSQETAAGDFPIGKFEDGGPDHRGDDVGFDPAKVAEANEQFRRRMAEKSGKA